MFNSTGIHDTTICTCSACVSFDPPKLPASSSVRKEIDQWELQKELHDFETAYGREALLEQVFRFLGAK